MTFESNMKGLRTRAGARAIGDRLRDMFDHLTSGPLPEHLINLVDQLEAAHAAEAARQAELAASAASAP